MRKLSRMLPALLLLTLFYFPSQAKADPIVITEGSLIRTGIDGVPTFTFSGLNFSVSGTGEGGTNIPCGPCTPSGIFSTFSLSATLGATHGSGTINGVTFPELHYEALLNFTAGTVTIPNVVASELELTVPFTFTGSLCALSAHSTINGCRPDMDDFVFSTLLSGQGTATIRFVLESITEGNGVPRYSFVSTTYTFSPPSPSNVPEPATLILLGTGLAGLAAGIRRRRARAVKDSSSEE